MTLRSIISAILAAGAIQLSGEANAETCTLPPGWAWNPPLYQEAAERFVSCVMFTGYVPVASFQPDGWDTWIVGDQGNVHVFQWFSVDDFMIRFTVPYDLTKHGFSSSLDRTPLNTQFSNLSFTITPKPEAPLTMQMTGDEYASYVILDKWFPLSSLTLQFSLDRPVSLTERVDSRSLFLSSFAYGSGGWDHSGSGVYVSALDANADLTRFIAVIPLPPALPLLFGGLFGLLLLRRKASVAV